VRLRISSITTWSIKESKGPPEIEREGPIGDGVVKVKQRGDRPERVYDIQGVMESGVLFTHRIK
jgi:hypothetical protein